MPRDARIAAREFAEEMRRPADQIGTKEVFDNIEDTRMCGEIVNGGDAILVAVNREAVPSMIEKHVQNCVEVPAIALRLVGRKHIDAGEIAARLKAHGLQQVLFNGPPGNRRGVLFAAPPVTLTYPHLRTELHKCNIQRSHNARI